MPGAMRHSRGDRNISKAHKQGTNGSSVGGMKMYTLNQVENGKLPKRGTE